MSRLSRRSLARAVCSQGIERAWPGIYLRHSAYGAAAGGENDSGIEEHRG
jgi:hypothetical protein